MRNLLALFVVVVAVTSPAFGQGTTAEQEVTVMLQKHRTALVQRDTLVLKEIWADEYTFTNASGQILSKAQRIANLRSGATALRSIKAPEQEVKVRVYGDAAVVTSRARIEGRYSGQEGTGEFRSLHVWVKRGGRWQLVANQITKVAGP
jgi:ketosteroid isomerase-like protein